MDYSLLPKVDQILLAVEKVPSMGDGYSRTVLAEAAREAIQNLREQISSGLSYTREELFDIAISSTLLIYDRKLRPSLRRVINATGVVLHTNLGRSLLAKEAAEAVGDIADKYCNLEIDLESGKRSSRYDHLRELLCALTGAEDAMAVNNNAAAVLLTLDTLTRGGEAIVSRGQLVEIGGSFRIPDIMVKSGTSLVEVGTTNKTHLSDYVNSINENTAALLQVHPSNFTMCGFVEEVGTSDLTKLAHENNIPMIYDLGSGCLYPFVEKAVGSEPLPKQLIGEGVDVLTFSGDKLLGGPQAGIIVGKKKYIDMIKKNPLTRALRIDKFTVAALEATLRIYRDGREQECIPTVSMLTASINELREKGKELYRLLADRAGAVSLYEVKLIEGVSLVGGGSLPGVELPTFILEIIPKRKKTTDLLADLRAGDPALLGYIHEDKALFDVRTITCDELKITAEAIIASV